MADEVYANGMEIACKAASGKSTAAFPDVCLSPPSPPAGPLPLPYPNTASASDTTNGSTTVMISGQEIMLKDRSTFKTSIGNEAATKSLGMGVVTHAIQGEASFVAWSMNVKVEGENVDRHLDMMIHNEQCYPPNAGPWVYVSKAAQSNPKMCKTEIENEKTACEDYDPHTSGGPSPCEDAGMTMGATEFREKYGEAGFEGLTKSIQQGGGKKPKNMTAKEKALECIKARRCQLVPYKPSHGSASCCPTQTADHVIPKSQFFDQTVKGPLLKEWRPTAKTGGYNEDKAPCMCLEGPNNTWANHGARHAYHKAFPPQEGGKSIRPNNMMSFETAKKHSAQGSAEVSGCSPECIKHQLQQGHEYMVEGKPPPKMKYKPSGRRKTKTEAKGNVKRLVGGK